MFTLGPKHWLSCSWQGHVFLHTARCYHRQCFYRPHKGQQNMASFAMSCPLAPGYQQETSFTEQEVLLSNWPKVIQWEPFFLPMRAQLFWERLYKQTCRASVRQSIDEVVGSRGFLVNWELSNKEGFFEDLQATSVIELLLPKNFHCSWLACEIWTSLKFQAKKFRGSLLVKNYTKIVPLLETSFCHWGRQLPARLCSIYP